MERTCSKEAEIRAHVKIADGFTGVFRERDVWFCG